ncbi:keratin-associated protein 10-7-like [Pantherophis guttatus]|uniref:Galectin n=1 Tax=Pantherophis guttatus TaxID=94885 RepID=A0ABM3ZLJ1_PANGU|nr:keratin-associated protein 10-7-like [Pantherophis guttatus]
MSDPFSCNQICSTFSQMDPLCCNPICPTLSQTYAVCSNTVFPTFPQMDPLCCNPICPTPLQTYPVCSNPIFPAFPQTYPVCSNPILPTFPQTYAVCSNTVFPTPSQVHVDGKKYLKFKHRIPLSRVDNIGISGELNVDSVCFQGPITYPVCCKPICPTLSQTYPVCCKPICPTLSQTYPVCCKPICPTTSQVLVDGKLHLEFKQKICLSQVNNVGISGQLDVDSVSFQGPFTHPVCCKPICPAPSQPIAYPIGQCFQPKFM